MPNRTPSQLAEAPAAPPEIQLLLTACRVALGQPCIDELLRQADALVHGDRVLAMAQRHAIVPLLHRALDQLPATAVPDRIAQAVRQQFERNALRNLALGSELVDILDLLDIEGVQAMPVKGPLLALTAYGDLALRNFLDLDVMVRRPDRDRALRVLREAGYRATRPLGRGAEAALLASDYHLQLVHDGRGVLLELHWALGRDMFGNHLNDSWAWTHARIIQVLGRSVPTLSPDALLVYLCVHGAKHMWSQLSWLCDVAAVLHAVPAPQPSGVWELARAGGARRMVRLGTRLAGALLDAASIPDIGTASEADELGALAMRVMAQLFDPTGRVPDGEALAFQLAVRDGWRDRAGLWAHFLVSPRVADVTAYSLPPALRSLYRVLRPVRLLVQHGRASAAAGASRLRR